jgi:hypothetical protein
MQANSLIPMPVLVCGGRHHSVTVVTQLQATGLTESEFLTVKIAVVVDFQIPKL